MRDFRPSALLLVFVNSVPLVGVWFFEWSIFDIVFLYWAENVVIGAVNVLRMIATGIVANIGPGVDGDYRAAGKRDGSAQSLIMIPFFAVHYGMFCYGHQVFLVDIFGEGQTFFALLSDSLIWMGIAAIAASHFFSFVTNFLIGGEYRRTTAKALMMRPYGRIIVLHVAIVFGSFLVQSLGEPVLLLIVLIVIKTLLDLKQHGRERSLFAPGNPQSADF